MASGKGSLWEVTTFEFGLVAWCLVGVLVFLDEEHRRGAMSFCGGGGGEAWSLSVPSLLFYLFPS